MKSTDLLKKLKVRTGLQMTTFVVRNRPFISVDFFYDRIKELFAIRLHWPGKSKTVYLVNSDVETKSKSMWITEKTFTLTDSCIDRLAPSLDNAIANALKNTT